MSNKPIIVIGAGGHAKVCIDLLKCCDLEILGFVTLDASVESILGVRYLGDDEVVLSYDPQDILLVNGVGYMPRRTWRYDLYHKFRSRGYHFEKLVHPSAIVASDVELEEGSQIMAGTIIQSSTQVGENSIVNTKASVDHDGVIGAHCHIAPGATLSGSVVLKDHVFVGAGATIIQNIELVAGAIIAAGTTVRKDITNESVVYG